MPKCAISSSSKNIFPYPVRQHPGLMLSSHLMIPNQTSFPIKPLANNHDKKFLSFTYCWNTISTISNLLELLDTLKFFLFDIITFQTFLFRYYKPSPSGKVIAKELLLIQATQLRWTRFYDLLIKSDTDFRNELKKYYKLDDDTRSSILESKEVKEGEEYDLSVRSLLLNFKDDKELWKFLEKNSDTLNNIQDWTIYRRATVVSTEQTEKPKVSYKDSIKIESIDEADEAIKLDPRNSIAWYKKSSYSIKKGNVDEGIEDLEKAILLDKSLIEQLATDVDLDPIRRDKRFIKLISSLERPR